MNNVDFYLFLTFSGLICHLAFKGPRIFCVALCRMIVQETEFEVATRRRLHQQKQVPKEFLKYMSHGCVFLRWCRYFPQFVTVIRYSRWVLSEEKKKYIKDMCFIHSLPGFLILHFLHQQNGFWQCVTRSFWITQLSISPILLAVNFFLNQDLLIFLFYVRQTHI